MGKQEILDYTQNRELSWLRFNQRVLEEARDETVPLMERIKSAIKPMPRSRNSSSRTACAVWI